VGHKGPVLGPRYIGSEKGSNPYIILFYSILSTSKTKFKEGITGEEIEDKQ